MKNGLIVGSVLALGLITYHVHEQSSLGYQVQKDARTLAADLFSDAAFRAAINGTTPFNDSTTRQLWVGFNFYSSTYRLARRSAIPNELVESVKRDFCDFVALKTISAKWNEMKATGQLGPIHTAMREAWCQ
jgi:hypothetical protein